MPAVSIAVIGASVRGTSLVERLTASAPELLGGRALVIHMIDPHPPGSGRIWRAGQPVELLMNTVAAQSTLFTDASVAVEGPHVPGPTLAEWCRLVAGDPDVAGPDAAPSVVAEARSTEEWSNPSRLLYGHYLRWCLTRITAAAPPQVEIRSHRARAIDLRRGPGAVEVVLEGGAMIAADAVLLALGWLDRDDVEEHPRVIAPANPIDQDLSRISAGDRVGVRGLGMGFFDTLSQLTEGRGGRYTDRRDGTIVYTPSGREPHLIVGSRRGVPYRAKPAFGAPPFFPEQRILRAGLPRLRARRPVDFGVEVLPLIERDAAFDYYRALAALRPDAVQDADALLEALRNGETPIERLAALHVPRVADRLALDEAADPLGGSEPSADDRDGVIADIVRRDADEAALGMRSPLKLALHSYAAARSVVIPLVEFGGLQERSVPAYRRFLAVAASFGSGPPLRRTRQLLAAHEAGFVTFAGPRMHTGMRSDHVELHTPGAPAVRVDWVVEAWLPAPTVEHTGDALLRALLQRGLARPWRFPDGTPSDALDIRPDDGALIGADGSAWERVFSVGVPHEDIRVFTIIAPVPGTNSSVLRETDAAARAALRAASKKSDRRVEVLP